jgi:His/Glu/Gln/Arg/opine family amino acid ABC transporter permease subunit
LDYSFDWTVLWRYREALWTGLVITVELSIVALVAAIFIGILIGTVSTSRNRWFRLAAYAYVEFARNIPLLVHILFWYIGLSALRIPNFWCAVLGLAIHSGAYIAEIVKSGIQSVPAGQTEAAISSGLSRYQTRMDVVYPQALRIVIPSMAGMFSQLIKDSSLASVIAVTELAFQAGAIEGETFRSFEAYIGISILYLIFVSLVTQSLNLLFAQRERPSKANAL